jgi:hypothetical protein
MISNGRVVCGSRWVKLEVAQGYGPREPSVYDRSARWLDSFKAGYTPKGTGGLCTRRAGLARLLAGRSDTMILLFRHAARWICT